MELNNQEEIPISSNENIYNTLNQNIPSSTENFEPNKEKKSIKFDANSISVIPIQETYNLRYGNDINGNNELDSQTKKIINDPKYANEKRSKSAFSKKSFREKYEPMKIKVPTNREWNRDPTAEVIIHNLEQKIDILTYENFLLSKKLREIENSNKELKLNISRNLMIMKAEEEINNEEKLKNNNLTNLNNIENKNNKKNKKAKKENDVDLFEEINRIKDENNRLRLSNQNLAENNAELNKVIESLKSGTQLNKDNKENMEENKNNILTDKSPNINLEDNINNEKNENNIINIVNNTNDSKMEDEQNNSEVDINKYLITEGQYHQLIEENELLHKKLRTLLLIEKDPNLNMKNSIDKSININKNVIIKSNKDNQKDDVTKENYTLKQKIKSLNGEINRMAAEYNRKLLIIQAKLDEYESKQTQNEIMNKNKLNELYEEEKNRKDEELDEILNETLLVINRNQDDEESKRMIETIKNIKDEQKKRISQCLIINNKLKSLLQEKAQLNNQLLMSKKDNDINNNTNSNFNNTNSSNMNNNTNAHICFCGSGNFSVNALKIKDEMIIKYKDKIDENNEMLKLTQNSNNSNNKTNELNFMEKDYKSSNKYKRERNDGFEDYLLGKIVNNQKEVLGERAPRFYENNLNNNKSITKSMQYGDNNSMMNNRYNNYHYRGRIIESEE